MLLLASFLPAAPSAEAAPGAVLLTLVVLMSAAAGRTASRPWPTTALILAVALFGFLAYSAIQPDPLVDPAQLTPVTVTLYGALVGLVAYIGYRLHRARTPASSATEAELQDGSPLPVRYVRRARAELDEVMGEPID